jgi:hypothetical protein
MGSRSLTVVWATAAFLACLPGMAGAQSQITGAVKDEQSGVLPGVTVEAASPVLIEQSRSVVTDSEGRYRIVDLRPGTYKLTFSLTGFSTLVKDGVDLPANFTSTINVDMKVGSLEETITVSGETSVVDVQQASRTQVLTRDLLDNLPIARTIQTIGMPIPGVRMSAQDVAGSRSTGQTNMSAHGMAGRNNTLQLDGQQINSQENNGEQFGYLNDALNAEASVSTYAAPAEVSGGGIRVNTIPRDGGNIFSGTVFVGGSSGKWQSNNADPTKLQGVVSPPALKHIQNFNGSVAGPIERNKLWFFVSPRHLETSTAIVNSLQDDGKQSYAGTYVRNLTGRLTYQLNAKNKLSATQDRVFKGIPLTQAQGTDPSAATTRSSLNGIYNFGTAKWTSTMTSRWLLEGGYSQYRVDYETHPFPSDTFARGTADWFANAAHTNNVLIRVPECKLVAGCTTWHSAGGTSRSHNLREVLSAAASHVTGSHNLKTGISWSWGYNDTYADRQADLIQQYRNGVANQVQIFNTPNITKATVKYDLGIYVQDTWTIKRLTLNPGLRIENFNSYIPENSMAAGRFVPARFYPAQTNLPNWNGNLAPRFGVAYDLFGNGKTALKGNVSKYYEAWTGLFASRYSPVASSTSTFNWTDSNNDDIAQDSEFLTAAGVTGGSNANFGKSIVSRAPDPNEVRAFNRETSIQLTHQLARGMSVNFGWFHRVWKDVEASDNTLTTQADWTSPRGVTFQVANPLDPAQSITAYELNSAVRSQSFTLDYTNKAYHSSYDGFEFSFQSRLHNGASVFGGVTIERNLTTDCGASDDPNATGVDRYAGFTVATGLQKGPDGKLWCDQNNISIPFSKELKLSGTQPLGFNTTFGAALQSLPGDQYVYTYALQNADFPGKTNVGTPQTLLLNRPGSLRYPRFFQLDVNVKKNLRWAGKEFSGQVDVFNVTNSNSIQAKTTAVTLTSTGAVSTNLNNVTTFLPARTVRLAFQMKW